MTMLRTSQLATAVVLLLAAFAQAPAPVHADTRVYQLVAYDTPGANRIVSGTITTDGTLGNGLDPTAIIIDYTATLSDGSTITVIDFATNGVFENGATITATATELTLDAGTDAVWCLSSTCGPPNAIVYEDFLFAPTEMNVLLYVDGPPDDQGLVGSRVIATVPPNLYQLIAYDTPGANRIVSGTITTDGTLGNGLDPTAIITDYTATLSDGSTITAIDFATNSLAEFGATITATATELTLDAGTDAFWCLSSTCGPPNAIGYQDFLFAPTEMNVILYVDGSPDDQGLVGSRVIAVPEPAAIVSLVSGMALLSWLHRRRRSPM
jgi:hypothetical protein